MASKKTNNFVNPITTRGMGGGAVKKVYVAQCKRLKTLTLFRIFIHLNVGAIFEKTAQEILKLLIVFSTKKKLS